MKQISILLTSVALLIGINSAYAQNCNSKVKQTTPDSRFEDLKNGTVKDTQTGLIWQRCSIGQTWMNGQCKGEAKTLSWHDALTEAKKYGDGWRLPNIKELSSIIENQCNNPAINLNIFSVQSKNYWSATPYEFQNDAGLKKELGIQNLSMTNGTSIIKPAERENQSVYGLAVKSPK